MFHMLTEKEKRGWRGWRWREERLLFCCFL